MTIPIDDIPDDSNYQEILPLFFFWLVGEIRAIFKDRRQTPDNVIDMMNTGKGRIGARVSTERRAPGV
jgi:hypothetical protein